MQAARGSQAMRMPGLLGRLNCQSDGPWSVQDLLLLPLPLPRLLVHTERLAGGGASSGLELLLTTEKGPAMRDVGERRYYIRSNKVSAMTLRSGRGVETRQRHRG